MTEAELLKEALAYAGNCPDLHLARQHSGRFKSLKGDRVIVVNTLGTPDLVGYRTRRIKEEHVGRLVPVFTAIELKGPTGRLTKAQQAYLDRVGFAGGLAGVAYNFDQFYEILREPFSVKL